MAILTCVSLRPHSLTLTVLFTSTLFSLSLFDLIGQDGFGTIEVGTSINPVGSGARALGVGNAFIAIADDATRRVLESGRNNPVAKARTIGCR